MTTIEYIPFHKNCKTIVNVGELQITPDGVGCKTNEYLMVMYFACKTREEMQEIQDNGFQPTDGVLGKGVYMFPSYSEAAAISDRYIIFTRITKGRCKELLPRELPGFDPKGFDRAVLVDNGVETNCIYNIAVIDVIAFIEFE